jgi:hypothetical protein
LKVWGFSDTENERKPCRRGGPVVGAEIFSSSRFGFIKEQGSQTPVLKSLTALFI